MERYMILLKPGGKCRLIPCDKDGTLTLQAMQVLVDGPIETAASILGPCWAREPVDSIKLILNEAARAQRRCHRPVCPLRPGHDRGRRPSGSCPRG